MGSNRERCPGSNGVVVGTVATIMIVATAAAQHRDINKTSFDATPLKIAIGDTPPAEVIWIDGAGRATVGDGTAQALENADGDAVAAVVVHPATGRPIAPPSGRAAAASGGGGFTAGFLSNGLGDEGDTPTEIVFTPDGAKIVVAHRDSQNLTVFDANTRAVLATIPLSGSPNALAITADGTRAVTANIFEDSASIVDLTTNTETAVIGVGDQPGVVRISPDGATAVIGNTVEASLTIIDIASETATDIISGVEFSSITSIAFEHGATVSKFTRFEFTGPTALIHPERFNSQVKFIDIVAGTVTPLATDANPAGLDVSPDGTTAVVAHGSSTQLVSVIDVASQTVIDVIPTGADMAFATIAMNPSKTKAVVGVQNAVRVVNLVSGTVSSDISTASISDLAVTADGLYCLGIGYNGALISFATESVVAELDGVVSVQVGAHSPVGPRAAMAGYLFTEEMLVVNTNGAAGFLEDRIPSGPPPEGDKARHVAISPDGSTALAVNILSDNVSVIDLSVPEVTDILAVGDRPSEIAFTPDGATAVVANLDSTFASVIDVAAGTATTVGISRRASQVEISPDGQYAYLCVVADGDGVWRIDLDTLTVAGPRIFTGNMGGIFFLYQQASGMTLSHDGATLVTCNSVDNNISIIDTASWTEVTRLSVGAFPVRAAFSPDDANIYVTNKDGDNVAVVDNAGAASIVTGTFAVGDQPFDIVVTPNGLKAFVSNFNASTISVLALTASPTVGTIAVNEHVQDLHLDAAGQRLYAAGGNWSVSIGPGPVVALNQSGEFTVIDAITNGILEQIDTGLPPGNLAFRDAAPLGVVSSPHGDGVALIAGPSCAGDVDGDGDADFQDLLLLLTVWGPCAGCDADLDGSDTVDFQDLLILLANWGPCP